MKKMRLIVALILSSTLIISCNSNNKDKVLVKDSVKVVPKEVPGTPIKYDSSKRYIFLTWDDSPQPPGTIRCKTAFKTQGVKASFFAVAAHYGIEPSRKRILDSLKKEYPEFLVCNHSSTHAFKDNYNFFYTHVDSAVKDFLKAEVTMNIPVKIIRLPGRNTWAGKGEFRGPKTSEKVAKKLDSLGYSIIGWDVEWGMVRGNTPKESPTELVNLINKKFDDGYTNQPNAIVILAHDRMFALPQHIDSLNRFISLLKQDPRNVFETIDHYPSVQK